MLRKLTYFLLAEVALCAGGYAVTLHFPEWSSAVWFGISGSAILGILLLWLHERYWVKPRIRVYFDMPVREAVNHLVYTVPHSFDSADKAERFFFGRLYTLMCEGKLPVIGARGEGEPPQRISRRQCRRHRPLVSDVAANPTSPDGVQFNLIDRKVKNITLVPLKPFPGLTGLRVRSSKLFSLYPQNKSGGGGE